MLSSEVPLFWWNSADNFGDQLSPVIIKSIFNLNVKYASPSQSNKLVSCGSVLSVAKPGDIVWGSGCKDEALNLQGINIYGVRGPLTLEKCIQYSANIQSASLGDPALLLPKFYQPTQIPYLKGKILVLPHFLDTSNWIDTLSHDQSFVILSLSTPDWKAIVNCIYSCDLVLSSSLHAIIVADAYKKPSILLKCSEPDFKYYDYFYSVSSRKKRIDPSLPLSKILSTDSNPSTIKLNHLFSSIPLLRNVFQNRGY